LSERQLVAGEDLANALSAAEPGLLLRLGPGDFHLRRPVRLRHPIRILGSGSQATRIVANATGLALDARQGASLASLTFHYEADGPGSLFAVRKGHCDVRDCVFLGARQEIREEDLVGGGAILLCGDVSGLIDNCIFKNNQGDAIALVDRAACTIERCRFSENGNGVAYYGGGGTVRANVFESQRNNGVIVYNAGSPMIIANQFSHNRQGVCLFGNAEVIVRDNLAEHNETGISALPNRHAIAVAHRRALGFNDLAPFGPTAFIALAQPGLERGRK
jgi:parallel beta-helix repeat protein